MTTNFKNQEFPPIHVLVCGDRNWDDDYITTIFITGIKFWHGLNIHVWHGGAPGADTLAQEAAKATQGISLHPYPADWSQGRSAGPKRNRQMLKAFLKETRRCRDTAYAIAFKDDLDDPAHKGTKDMVSLALQADIPVYVISRPLLDDLK